MSDKILVIVDNLEGRIFDLLDEIHPEGKVDILTLGFTEQLFLKDNEERIRTVLKDFSFVDITQIYLQAQSLTRNYCLNLKMKLPEKALYNKSTFFDLFNFNGFNVWWFLGFSEMGSFRIKFIDQLYFLTLIKLVLKNNYTTVYLDLNDRYLKQVIERSLYEQNLSFLSVKSKTISFLNTVKEKFLFWWFVSQFFFLITQLFKTVSLRLFSIGYKPDKTTGFISFFSFFPALWFKKSNHYFQNGIYKSLLNYTSDFYQSYHLIYSTDLIDSFKTVIKNVKQFKKQKIIFLERYIPFRGFMFFFNYKYYLSIFKYNWDYKKQISEVYEGYDISNLIRKSIDTSLFDKEFYRDIFIYYSVKTVTTKFNLKGIVHPSEFQCYEKAIWSSAKSEGCPTIALQHSAIGKNWLNYYFVPEGFARMPLPDLYLCSGGYPYDVMRQNNMPIQKVKLNGAFRYDHLNDYIDNQKSKYEFRKNLGLKEKENILIVLSGVNKRESLDMINNVAEYVKKTKLEIQILFKSHPIRIIDHEVQEIFKKKKIDNLLKVIPVRSNYYDYLSAADVCCFCNSTIGIESIALNIPSISFDNIHSIISFDMIEVGNAVFHVKTTKDFQIAIQNILNNNEKLKEVKSLRDEALYKTFYKLDGKSMERFVSNISEILS